MSKRKFPSPPQPPTEPHYEILAEGNPPRPVKRRNADDPVIDSTPPRKSPPKRGPKTKAGKERSSQNATKHGLRQDIRHFRVLRTEDQSVFNESVTTLLSELQPWDSTTQDLIQTMAQTRWHLHRAEFYFESDLDRAGEDADFITTASKYERYRASCQRRMNQVQKLFAELRAAHRKEEQTTATEAAKLPPYGPDGKNYEVDRQYQICKFSNNASPRHYIHNYATEKIIMSDGKYWFARTIPLAELMEGEFLKPQYGLGNHFAEAFREWRKTHKLYHPGVPYATKKWPPPIPKDCPPDDWFLDPELSLAEDPVAILKQRARKMDEDERRQREEEAAEWRRKIEEARQQEAEDQRLELEAELRPKEDKEKEEETQETQDEEHGRKDFDDEPRAG